MFNTNSASDSADILFSAAQELATHKHDEGIMTRTGPLHGLGIEELLFGRVTAKEMLLTSLNQAMKGTLPTRSNSMGPEAWAVMVDAQRAASLLDRAVACETAPVPSPFQAAEYRAAANRAMVEAASWLF